MQRIPPALLASYRALYVILRGDAAEAEDEINRCVHTSWCVTRSSSYMFQTYVEAPVITKARHLVMYALPYGSTFSPQKPKRVSCCSLVQRGLVASSYCCTVCGSAFVLLISSEQ